jgi:surface polysaccharide O-acyltransferase-like enzyme
MLSGIPKSFLAKNKNASLIEQSEANSIQENSKPQSGFSLSVDLIRAVAIIMVIMYHAANEPYDAIHLTNNQYLTLWWSTTIYGALVIMGVPLFVMLSGALLLQPAKVEEPIKVFLKKRLSRIGLAFFFWSAIYFVWGYYVNNTQLTLNSVTQMLLSDGAYYQFWFIYLIVGLYLITPILRVIVAYANQKIIRYFIILWFITVAIIPIFHLITGFGVNNNLFVFGGYIGYFILGSYLLGTQLKSGTLKKLLLVSVVWTIIGTWLMAYPFHSVGQYYFFFYTLSANVILASVSVFMLIGRQQPNWSLNKHSQIRKVIQVISQNTLPIFFIHVIILESLEKGFFGFKLSLMLINPFIEIPLATIVTLFVALGLILLMKKVPVLKKLIG